MATWKIMGTSLRFMEVSRKIHGKTCESHKKIYVNIVISLINGGFDDLNGNFMGKNLLYT
jgi:hypothetical protein